MFFQHAMVKNPDPYPVTSDKCPHAVIIHLLHVSEPVSGKIVLNIRKKCDLLSDAGNLVFPRFCSCLLTEILDRKSVV